jgi:penicillin-binding protein 2
MLVAIAALNEGIVNENTTIYCPGSFTFGNRSYKCHGAHGAVNVRSAIKASCNVYFYQLGLKIGMENLEKYGKMFGFGQKTFIDLPNEKSGRLPTVEWLKKYMGKVEHLREDLSILALVREKYLLHHFKWQHTRQQLQTKAHIINLIL